MQVLLLYEYLKYFLVFMELGGMCRVYCIGIVGKFAEYLCTTKQYKSPQNQYIIYYILLSKDQSNQFPTTTQNEPELIENRH